jgi:hypothetical protein
LLKTNGGNFEENRRLNIVLGAVAHAEIGVATITAIVNTPTPISQSLNSLADLSAALGSFNIAGNTYQPFATNLQIERTAGVLWRLGSNFANDIQNPHRLSLPAESPITSFTYVTRTQTQSTGNTVIDPANYNPTGDTLTAVSPNNFTLQYINVLVSGLTIIQYGQNQYNTIEQAIDATGTESFENFFGGLVNVFRYWLVLKNNVTDLTNTAEARFIEAGKFGGSSASGGTTLQPAEELATTGSAVVINSGPQPTVGQALIATSPTNATWQDIPSGGGGAVQFFTNIAYEPFGDGTNPPIGIWNTASLKATNNTGTLQYLTTTSPPYWVEVSLDVENYSSAASNTGEVTFLQTNNTFIPLPSNIATGSYHTVSGGAGSSGSTLSSDPITNMNGYIYLRSATEWAIKTWASNGSAAAAILTRATIRYQTNTAPA